MPTVSFLFSLFMASETSTLEFCCRVSCGFQNRSTRSTLWCIRIGSDVGSSDPSFCMDEFPSARILRTIYQLLKIASGVWPSLFNFFFWFLQQKILLTTLLYSVGLLCGFSSVLPSLAFGISAWTLSQVRLWQLRACIGGTCHLNIHRGVATEMWTFFLISIQKPLCADVSACSLTLR